MVTSIKGKFIEVLFKISAQRSSQHLATVLRKFSIIEADSAWQMTNAMRFSSDPAYQYNLFLNALEEHHHAYLFNEAANRYKKSIIFVKPERRDRLVNNKKSLIFFKVYHYIGEKDIYNDFSSYSKGSPDDYLKALYQEIRGDEYEHQLQAYQELKNELKHPARLHYYILHARAVKLKNLLIRFGYSIQFLIVSLLMLPVFMLSGLLLARTSKSILSKKEI
jgi:hypothetical protein